MLVKNISYPDATFSHAERLNDYKISIVKYIYIPKFERK